MQQQLPGLSKYTIHSDGYVTSIVTGKRLVGTITDDGYVVVKLTGDDGRKKRYKLHRLVAIAYIPNPDNLPDVNHKHGDKRDNSAHMLEWMSRKDNIIHAYQTGLIRNKKGKRRNVRHKMKAVKKQQWI